MTKNKEYNRYFLFTGLINGNIYKFLEAAKSTTNIFQSLPVLTKMLFKKLS